MVAPAGRRRVSQHVAHEFAELDRWAPKFDHWWAFPVCGYDHTLTGNERAVFEEVRHDPSIRKIILTRSKPVSLDGADVHVVPLDSEAGREMLARSRHVFVKHGVAVNLGLPLDATLHNVVNLWHGIPLKRFGFTSLDTVDHRDVVAREHALNRCVIASSSTDRLAMTAAFYPLTFDHVWVTGLPRNDLLLRADARLPSDLAGQQAALQEEVGDRRLVLYLPTFRNAQTAGAYQFSDEEKDSLADWCDRQGAVLGIREHMADTGRTYSRGLSSLGALDLSAGRYPDIEVLYRVAAAMITDYSSCVVDFMLTGRPVVSFAYDLEKYSTEERGLFYDLADVLPGPVVTDFAGLAAALEDLFSTRDPEDAETYAHCRSLFFDYLDDRSASRVVRRVKSLYSAVVGHEPVPDRPLTLG
jgi:CDP-glycerol glycerophosphotransferase (TagB/SpsB family)